MKVSWSTHVREQQGTLITLRLNDEMQDYICHPNYSHLFGVSLNVKKPDVRGFPDTDESGVLDELESLLREQLVDNMLCVFVAVITSSGTREYVFYTYSPEQCFKAVNMINESWLYHELESTAEEDKDWHALEALLK